MSFFEDASLVLIPSAQKTSKVYSVKPTDGTGDLTFTRTGDTATRVGPDGLIEKVRTNVALYSEQFNNANWGPTNATVTANTTTAPDGTTTADSVAFTALSSARLEGLTAGSSPAGEITLSIYAKVASGTGSFRLRGDWSGGNSISTDFAVTTSWQRFTHTFTAASALQIMSLYNNTAGTAQTIIFWGAQAESGVATPYIATTTAAVSVGMLANVPRLDYLGGGCPKLLLEPQRSNRAQFSEQFSNAFYTKDNVTISSNVAVSPDGFTNADKVVPTAGFGEHLVYYFDSLNGGSGTISLFVKKAEYRYAILRSFIGTYAITVFDFDTLTFPVQTLGTGRAESYGNGWYRISVAFTLPVSGAYGVQFGFSPITDHVFTGDGTSGGFAYGFQFEQGSYATSYIPTLGAAVTRSADAASKTGISALIGQTEGTIFVDFVMSNNSTDMVPFDIAGSDGKLIWIRNAGAQFYGNGTTLIANIGISAGTQGTRYKVAFVYGQNDFRLYRNGSLIGTDTSGTFTGTFSDISLNAVINQANLFNQVLIFKTKLTNAQLAELTTI